MYVKKYVKMFPIIVFLYNFIDNYMDANFELQYTSSTFGHFFFFVFII